MAASLKSKPILYFRCSVTIILYHLTGIGNDRILLFWGTPPPTRRALTANGANGELEILRRGVMMEDLGRQMVLSGKAPSLRQMCLAFIFQMFDVYGFWFANYCVVCEFLFLFVFCLLNFPFGAVFLYLRFLFSKYFFWWDTQQFGLVGQQKESSKKGK